MVKELQKSWENKLKLYDNKKYLNNWEMLSNRFWKKTLLKLFLEWNECLKNKEDFKLIFGSKVLNPLKEAKNVEFVQKTTYNSLMSLFSKFHYFLKEYAVWLSNNLKINIEVPKINQEEVKNEISINFKNVEKKDQIMDYERSLFKINAVWDIVAPWPSKDDLEEDYIDNNIAKESVVNDLENESKILKENQDKFNYGTQLEIQFD